MRERVVEIELAEPAVGQMQFNFLAEAALRENAVAVAHEQHPDHEFGINRRSSDLGIVRLKLLV